MNIKDLIAIANRSRSRRPPRDEEHRLQSACVRWFNLQYPQHRGKLFAIPNGGHRHKATAARLKAEGVVAGVADLALIIARHNYHSLFLELKTPHGRQSDTQRQWQRIAEEEDHLYRIVRSVDDFQQIINNYLND